MKLRFCIILLFLPSILLPTDQSKWILSTDRLSNPVIIEYISQGDIGMGIEVVKTLGRRDDSYITDIINNLMSSFSSKLFFENELLLRILISAVFPPSMGTTELKQRILINSEGIDLLEKNIDRFKDPQLTAEIFRIISYRPINNGILPAEGKKIEQLLLDQSGAVNASQADLILAYLGAVELSNNSDYAEVCLSIYELARNSAIADRSKKAALKLLQASITEKTRK